MEQGKTKRLAREDWLKAALSLCAAGIDSVKVAPLAERLGVTTGSFYWHFKNRRELLEALLDYWEHETTDMAIAAAREFAGSPTNRILFERRSARRGRDSPESARGYRRRRYRSGWPRSGLIPPSR
jgi:AcrR family transcriptional regulator